MNGVPPIKGRARKNLFLVWLVGVHARPTVHRDFPKNELLAEVGEMKGKDAKAKAARAARRGKQVAFVGDYTMGTYTLNVLSAGQNKKST
eukprot:2432173-Pleurochrysis_carterae.AAC.1